MSSPPLQLPWTATTIGRTLVVVLVHGLDDWKNFHSPGVLDLWPST